MLAVSAVLVTPAFAVTEAEVEAQVAAVGKETVTGNVLIWFLCAIAFLKVSQKIDSFMASLGVNVGHTGGSMMAEAMIAMRGIGAVTGGFGKGGSSRSSGSSGSSAGSAGSSGFFKGGLAGMVSRKVTNDAVKTATSTTSAVQRAATESAVQRKTSVGEQISRSAQTNSHASTTQTASHDAQVRSSQSVSQTVHTEAQQSVSKDAQVKSSHTTAQESKISLSKTVSGHQHTSVPGSVAKPVPSFRGVGVGGAVFAKSLLSGGSFANDVIGRVARGDMRSTGSITGELAAQSLQSYMGLTALGDWAKDLPTFSDVEIGGGRITGIETAAGSSEGLAFGMYHADQYAAPQGDYTTVHSADGTRWYKQYAQDAVERKPYKAPDGTVAYQESIVKKLPDPPRRKDRM